MYALCIHNTRGSYLHEIQSTCVLLFSIYIWYQDLGLSFKSSPKWSLGKTGSLADWATLFSTCVSLPNVTPGIGCMPTLSMLSSLKSSRWQKNLSTLFLSPLSWIIGFASLSNVSPSYNHHNMHMEGGHKQPTSLIMCWLEQEHKPFSVACIIFTQNLNFGSIKTLQT